MATPSDAQTARLAASGLSAAVEVANIPTLLLLLVQLTGDESWLEAPYRPALARGIDDNDSGGLSDGLQAEVRAAASEAIAGWLADGAVAIERPTADQVVRWLSSAAGEDIPREYGPMVQREIASAGQSLPPGDGLAGLDAIIIGGGVSGIAAAARLGAAGLRYRLIERNSRLGGVWNENRYPAAAVDTPSHLYSYSFAPGDWPRWYGTREHIQDYLESVAAQYDVPSRVEFSTTAERAEWDADSRAWRVEVCRADGHREVLTARLLVSAVGAFNTPMTPAIPGRDVFEGPAFHTARWPAEVDLADKRVAVVGNGASAMQVVPAIAADVARLFVFQREPHWIAPFPRFKQPAPEPVRALMQAVPLYAAWYRARLGWIFNDKLFPVLRKDPDWPHPERSTNAQSEALRGLLTRYIKSELGGRTDLLSSLIPSYPPLGKRLLLDNGWYRTLCRGNVELVADRVTELRPHSVVTSSGREIEVDAVVFATGFDVVSFLSTIEVVGRSGVPLRKVWNGDDAAAYLGLAVPDFPNLFLLYGPNTQTGHGGSLISLVEAQLNHIMSLLEQMVAHDIETVEVKPEVHDAYNARVDSEHAGLVWTHPGMETYYRNSRGRVVVSCPWRVVDFWTMTERARLDDYVVEPAGAGRRSPGGAP
jgi:4-hydroxyacetophenone monooxygenase